MPAAWPMRRLSCSLLTYPEVSPVHTLQDPRDRSLLQKEEPM